MKTRAEWSGMSSQWLSKRCTVPRREMKVKMAFLRGSTTFQSSQRSEQSTTGMARMRAKRR